MKTLKMILAVAALSSCVGCNNLLAPKDMFPESAYKCEKHDSVVVFQSKDAKRALLGQYYTARNILADEDIRIYPSVENNVYSFRIDDKKGDAYNCMPLDPE